MPTQNLFTAGDLPPAEPNLWAEEANRTFGYTVKFDIDGSVTGVRVYGPSSTAPATTRVKFFLKSNESLLAAKTFPSTISTSTWNSIDFDSAVSVTANTEYVVCFFMSGEGNFAHTPNGLTSNKTNGHITGVGNEGRYKTGSGTDDFPGSTYGGLFFVDVNFSFSSEQIVPVGQAVESDVALAVTHARGATLGVATESDVALGVTSIKVIAVSQVVESDVALPVVASKLFPLDIATESDVALPVLNTKIVRLDIASERDIALPVSVAGMVDLSQHGRTDIWYLNDLANTIVAGVPSLSAVDAAAIWTVVSKTLALPGMLNIDQGKVLPNWLALQGILNEMAGTSGLSVTECLRRIANP